MLCNRYVCFKFTKILTICLDHRNRNIKTIATMSANIWAARVARTSLIAGLKGLTAQKSITKVVMSDK